MSTLMMIISLGVTGLLCIRLLLYPTIKNMVTYSTISMLLLILSSPYGLVQYYSLLIIPIFLILNYNGVLPFKRDLLAFLKK
jgi:hypothetical protein